MLDESKKMSACELARRFGSGKLPPMKAAIKQDRRTERTRAALMSAFLEIMFSDGYEGATVEKIAERANIGRSTFYFHYKSKEGILRASMARPSFHLAVIVGHDIAVERMVPVLLHFLENRKKNRVFFTWPVRGIWTSALADTISPRLASIARHARACPVLPLPMIARHIAEAQIALVADWVLANPSAKPEAVTQALIVSTHALLASLLQCAPDAPLTIPGEQLRFIEARK
jgi:AcrR family transcriptional regulator